MNESQSKYDKAVNKARAKENGAVVDEVALAPTTGNQALALPEMPGGAQSMVAPFNEVTFIDEMRANGWDCAPQIVELKAGFVYHGILEGNGPDAELTDAMTREMKVIQTWILRDKDSGVRISFLSSAQLDRKLPGFVGGEVKIARGSDRNIGGGKRLTEYFVGGPKSESGFRTWATKQPRFEES